MDISNCKRCGATTYNGQTVLGYQHACPPEWVVWCAEEGETRAEIEEEERLIFAADAREADRKHRGTVNGAARDALMAEGIAEDVATAVIVAIARGAVPAVRISY